MYQTLQCADLTVSQTVERVVGGVIDGARTGSLDVGFLMLQTGSDGMEQ
jgi:hypothetical protein